MQDRAARLFKHAEQLRARGEDGSADAALARLEAIMVKHSIDLATIQERAGATDREPIGSERIVFTGIYRAALSMKFIALVRAYTVAGDVLIERTSKTHVLILVGMRSDVQNLKMLITSLHLQAINAMERWWYAEPPERRYTGMLGFKTRRQFIANFIVGATERIAVARREVMDSTPGVLPVLRRRQADVEAYIAANYDTTTTRSRLKSGTLAAAQAGHTAGRWAQTDEPTVGGERRQLTT